MKFVSLLFLAWCCAICAFAQSGRVKPGEIPAPTPPRPRVVYLPTDDGNSEAIKPTPKIAPTPAKNKSDAGEDSDVLRVDSNLVPIPVSVTDAQGRAVTNLTIKDFDLEVDGTRVEISELFRSQSPVRLAVLFDNSSSVTQAREFEKRAAIKFFRQVIRPDRDQAALFSIASVAQLEQPLTKNISQLISAIENFSKPEGATALLDGIIQAADYLRLAEGRRVIVIVSDGEDTYSDLATTLEKTVQAAQRANCQIYVVKTSDFENYKQTGNRNPSSNVRFLAAERRMQELAGQTGGAVYSPIDERELEAAFARISAELSDQYVLNYYPEDASQNAQFHTISLRVKAKNDLTVRARKGYYVSRK